MTVMLRFTGGGEKVITGVRAFFPLPTGQYMVVTNDSADTFSSVSYFHTECATAQKGE